MALTLYGSAPAFSAIPNATQGINPSTWTKVSLQTEVFDTNSNFDNVTNYRFTPTIAGYYQFNLSIREAATNMTLMGVALYINGAVYTRQVIPNATTTGQYEVSTSALCYMNGSTDYAEMYGVITGTSPEYNRNAGAVYLTNFSGCLIRSAA